MELQVIQNKIYEIRGMQVMLDYDLAEMYQVETRILNQSVKRNIKRFPEDFMFQLNKAEFDRLVSQFVISNIGRGGRRLLPYAFTEQGLAMLSGILNSDIAIEVNISIMRAFVSIRRSILTASPTLEMISLQQRVKALEEQSHETLQALSDLSEDNQNSFDDIYLALSQLAAKNKNNEKKPRNPIGYVTNNRSD